MVPRPEICLLHGPEWSRRKCVSARPARNQAELQRSDRVPYRLCLDSPTSSSLKNSRMSRSAWLIPGRDVRKTLEKSHPMVLTYGPDSRNGSSTLIYCRGGRSSVSRSCRLELHQIPAAQGAVTLRLLTDCAARDRTRTSFHAKSFSLIRYPAQRALGAFSDRHNYFGRNLVRIAGPAIIA
jgi:hypothetical protein